MGLLAYERNLEHIRRMIYAIVNNKLIEKFATNLYEDMENKSKDNNDKKLEKKFGIKRDTPANF